MRVDIVRSRRYMSFLRAFICSMAVCMLCAVAMPADTEDADPPRGWGMDGLFIGVSVSMIQCLVVLLFFSLWMVAFAHFVSHISKFKSFATLVERYASLRKQDAEADYTVDERQLAADNSSSLHKNNARRDEQAPRRVMEIMKSVLHNRELTKKSLAP